MRSVFLATTAFSIAAAAYAPSAIAAVSVDQLEQQVKQLQAEIELLKRQREVDKEVTTTKEEKQASVELGSKGLSVTSADKHFNLKLRGYAQFDGRFFLDDDANNERTEFLARRLRPVLETRYDDFSFRLMPDFAGSTTKIYDAYADWRYDDALKVRVGKFKPPTGLERLQSDADMYFVERGQPSNLTPDRDIGLELYGELFEKTLEYQVGVFNGLADQTGGDGDDDDHKDVAARLFVKPFRNSDTLALHGLGVGVAGTVGEREGSAKTPLSPSYRTPGQQSFFAYRTGTAASDIAYADGEQWRLIPQAYWYYNNFGTLAEYAISSQEVTRGAASDRLEQRAWQVELSYVATGEDASYDGVKPKHPFDLKTGDWGALELLARVGETDIDDDAFPVFADPSKAASLAREFGGGFNWYLNDNVRLWLNYEYTTFEGGAAKGGDRPDEQVVLSRVQYKF